MKKIIEEYKNGKNVFDIAKSHNLTFEQVYKILYDNKVLKWQRDAIVENYHYMEKCATNKHQSTIKERNENIIKDFKSGMQHPHELAKKYNLSERSIYFILKSAGISLRKNNKLKYIPRNNKIIADFKSGMTLNELSEKYNLSPATVGKIVRDGGMCARNAISDNHSKSVSMVVDYYNKGLTRKEIADRLNTSIANVCILLKEVGITKKSEMLDRNANIINDFMSGLSRRELSSKYNISKTTVRSIILNQNKI